MSRRTRVIAMALAAVTVLALSGPALAGDKYIIHEDQRIDPTRKPEAGKALIYFVRPQTYGGAIKVRLFADGEFIGISHRKTFIPFECEPGKHEFFAVAENAGFLDAEVMADRIYYVQVAIHMGAMKARTHFEVATEGTEALEEILEKLTEVRAVSTTEEGLAWVAEDKAKLEKKMAKYRDKEKAILTPDQGYEEPLTK